MDNDEYMLTTVDNPYNPYTHYDQWYEYDTSKGYNSASFLARIAKTSDEMSDADQELAIEEAIDEICRENVLGIYTKAFMPKTTSVASS
jgi:hypothetical protein